MYRFYITTYLLLLIGLLFVGGAILNAISINGGKEWLLSGLFGLIGITLLATCLRSVISLYGKTVFKNIYQIKLLGRSEAQIIIPTAICGGKIVLFFNSSPDCYQGVIVAKRQQNNFASITLSPLKPSFGLKIPAWMRWLNIRYAGEIQEFWPKGGGPRFYPLVIPFNFHLAQGESITVEFDINADSKSVSPLAEIENVTICIQT